MLLFDKGTRTVKMTEKSDGLEAFCLAIMRQSRFPFSPVTTKIPFLETDNGMLNYPVEPCES